MPEAGPPAGGRQYASLDRLMAPRSVAVVGASSDPTRIGGRPIAYMRAAGFPRILPINPNRAEVQGLPAYPGVAALPEVPDVAIVAVPGELAQQALEDLGALGVRAAVVFTAGFAEVGEAHAQDRLLATARRHGMRMLGPNALGLFNARIGYYATFSASLEGGTPLPGRIGIASQSGAYGTHLFAAARARGMGTPLCVTTGNEADVTLADAIGWMAEDDGIDVIAAYSEGVRDGAGFVAALAAARRARKPVVIMKVGRSALGRQAAQSHTASLAGDDAVFDAVCADFAVVRARTTEALLDVAHTATRRIYPVRNTLGVITVSGGAGVLISDAAEALGLAMPAMPQDAQARLRGLLPFASPANPVDCTAQVFNDMSLVGRFADEMVDAGGYGSVLAFFSQTGDAPSIAPALRAQLNATKARHPDRLFVMSVLASDARVREYEADGFVVIADPTRAVVAIHAMGALGDAFARAPDAPAPVVAGVALPDVAPDEAAAKRLLAAAGIAGVPECACASAEAAVAAACGFGFPVVMKILSADIAHKSEIGGVLLDVGDAAAVRAGYATLLARAARHAPRARVDGVLVARQVSGGTECILGVTRDPQFGPVALFGLGGVYAEVLDDVALHRCPFGPDVAERMIRSIRGAPLLLGARGRPPADIAALAAMLSRLSAFAAAAGPRLAGVDLNPVFALPAGEGAFAADALIEVAP
jgi:acyl-CoA synthetase (NDP forming)